jgi:hypothetical protein
MVLMNDNDTKHTARLTCDFLAEEQIVVLEWLPHPQILIL